MDTFREISRHDWAETVNAHDDWEARPVESETMAVMQYVDPNGKLKAQAIYYHSRAPQYTLADDEPITHRMNIRAAMRVWAKSLDVMQLGTVQQLLERSRGDIKDIGHAFCDAIDNELAERD